MTNPAAAPRREAMRGSLRVLAMLVLCLAASLGMGCSARAQGIYKIDQRFGSIDFSLDNFGLFTVHGGFQRFAGTLTIDPSRPEQTSIVVKIDAKSVDMDSADGLTMVRSPDYFDVADHPEIDFHSTDVTVTSPDHYRIDGAIEIRGVTKPMILDAVLTGRAPGPSGPVSEFVVKGAINREAFGMVADQSFVSDTVQVRIRARIVLDHPAPPASPPNAG